MNLQNGILEKSNITDASAISNSWNGYGSAKDAGSSAVSLTPGQTIQGKIVSRDENGVKIQLDQGQTIQAKLEGSAQLKTGMSVTFSVQSSNASVVTLAPLYTNVSQDDTATKALINAGLPVNEKSYAMTGAMIMEGMSIDSNSLSAMFQKVSSFSSGSISSLVQMQRMGIEINPQNLEQFEAFQNYEKQITDGMHHVMEEVHSFYEEMLGNDPQGAVKFMGNILDSVLKNIEAFGGKEQPMMSMENRQEAWKSMTPAGNDKDAVFLTGKGAAIGPLADKGTYVASFPGKDAGEGVFLGETGKSGEEIPVLRGGDPLGERAAFSASFQKNTEAGREMQFREMAWISEEIQNPAVKDAWQRMGFGEKADFLHLLKTLGLSEFEDAMLRDPDSTSLQVLKAIHMLQNKGDAGDGSRQLFGNSIFRTLLNEQMAKNWTLQPDQVASKQNVDGLYQRINRQVQEFTQMLTELAKPESMLGQSLSNMNQNLDFMNQMNHVFPYIQLPLKMNGTDTTGELFVYTDKKSLAEKSGNVSALLHLDMENLGPIDVYAAISDQKNVSTKFTLPDEETIALLEQNISLLTKRLEKKGYHMHTEITMKDKETAQEEHGSAGTIPKADVASQKLIARYSFDAKA